MRWCALAVSLLALACTSTAEVPWDVRLADADLAGRAVIVDTAIRRGGCEGVTIYRASIARDRRGPPPELGRGLHGFYAEAHDAECRAIARGCVERDLPLSPGARVELVLEPAVETAACDVSRCHDGECALDDGGIDPIEDAGIDPIDAPPLACPGSTFGARCYELHTEAREWSAAEAVCTASGAHLTSIGGPEEASFVRNLGGTDEYWIGLHDLAAEGVWQWADGSVSSHRDWADGQPIDRDMLDCVADRAGSGWSVQRCREVHAFVCER